MCRHFKCPPDSRLSVKTSRTSAKSILNFPTQSSPGHIFPTAEVSKGRGTGSVELLREDVEVVGRAAPSWLHVTCNVGNGTSAQ